MVVTHEEANARRQERLFMTVDLAPFGSLWFVPEQLWKTAHKRCDYDQNSDRTGHPGCSLRRMNSTLGPVPLLHGTSRSSGKTVTVKNVLGDAHTTYFGSLPPVPCPMSHCMGSNRIRTTDKSRLTSDEEVTLMTLCVRKGWL